jgi:hypothetical protein
MDDELREHNKKYERPWTEMGAPRPPDLRDIYRWLRDGMREDAGDDEPQPHEPPLGDLREQE